MPATMGLFAWATDNWFSLLQSLGIIAGLIFTAVSFRIDTRSRRTAHLFTITEHYRDIWSSMYERPGLSRVLAKEVDLAQSPITDEEELLIRLLIFHLASVFSSQRDRLLVRFEGLQHDVRWFFSLPLPRAVWERKKPWQDADFVKFVDECLVREPIVTD